MLRYTRAEVMAAYWGIGTYWGKAQSNNKKGHLIGHIADIGHDPRKATTRLYATHEAQPYHNDSSDQVGARRARRPGCHKAQAHGFQMHVPPL